MPLTQLGFVDPLPLQAVGPYWYFVSFPCIVFRGSRLPGLILCGAAGDSFPWCQQRPAVGACQPRLCLGASSRSCCKPPLVGPGFSVVTNFAFAGLFSGLDLGISAVPLCSPRLHLCPGPADHANLFAACCRVRLNLVLLGFFLPKLPDDFRPPSIMWILLRPRRLNAK